jgi:membrane-associated phospholipid phosphatase
MNYFANFVSVLLIPLLVPTYLSGIVICYFPSLVRISHQNEKWMPIFGIFIFTVLLPFILVYSLFKMGKISSLSLVERKDRYVPQFFSCFTYFFITACFIYMFGPDNILSLGMIANSISVLIITVITRYWKISTHASGSIGLLVIVSIIFLKHPSPYFSVPYVILSVLCVSVCFARIYLKAHTVMQVIGGSVLGTALGISVFYFLK